MTLKKTIIVEHTGAPASTHRVDSVTISYTGNTTSAQVSSFYDDAAKKANLAPLTTSTMTIDGLPKSGKDPKAFVEGALAAPVPDGENGDSMLHQYGANRYAFSGADIVAD